MVWICRNPLHSRGNGVPVLEQVKDGECCPQCGRRECDQFLPGCVVCNDEGCFSCHADRLFAATHREVPKWKWRRSLIQ